MYDCFHFTCLIFTSKLHDDEYCKNNRFLWLVGRIHDVDIYVNGMKPFFSFQIPQDIMKAIDKTIP